MKKFLSLAIFALIMLLPSCGGSNSADSVAEKIENNKELDQKDYTVMIDYADKAVDAAGKLLETHKENPEQLQEKSEELNKEFPHFELFMQHMPNQDKLDDANKKKLEELTMKVIKMTMQAQMPVVDEPATEEPAAEPATEE